MVKKAELTFLDDFGDSAGGLSDWFGDLGVKE